MECLHPILIKKGDVLSPFKVPCGQCIACRLNRSSSWAIRIMHELRMWKGIGCFVTLTYDQANAPWVNDYQTSLYYPDIQDFHRNLRRLIDPFKFKFFCAGEYGGQTGRAHYHIIYFGIPKDVAECIFPDLWGKGHVHVGDVTYDSAMYVAKYCTKKLNGDKAEVYKEKGIVPEFSRMSRRPGIGATWIEKYANEVKQHLTLICKGKEVPVPRYYKDKVYDESDRSRSHDRSVDYYAKKEKQLTKDLKNDYDRFVKGLPETHLAEDRVNSREITLLRTLRERCG